MGFARENLKISCENHRRHTLSLLGLFKKVLKRLRVGLR